MPEFFETHDPRKGPSAVINALAKRIMKDELFLVENEPTHILSNYHHQLQSMIDDQMPQGDEVHAYHHRVQQSQTNALRLKHCKPPLTALSGLIQCFLYEDTSIKRLRPELKLLAFQQSGQETVTHHLSTILHHPLETITPYVDAIIAQHPTFEHDFNELEASSDHQRGSLWQALWQHTLTHLTEMLSSIPMDQAYSLDKALIELKHIDRFPLTHEGYLQDLITQPGENAFHDELLKMWKASTSDPSLPGFCDFIIAQLKHLGLGDVDHELIHNVVTRINKRNPQCFNVTDLIVAPDPEKFIAHTTRQYHKRHHIVLDTLGLYAYDTKPSDIQNLDASTFNTWVTACHQRHQSMFRRQYQGLLQSNASEHLYTGHPNFIITLNDYWYRWSALLKEPTTGFNFNINQGRIFADSQHYSLIALQGRPRCYLGLNEEATQHVMITGAPAEQLQASTAQQALRTIAESIFNLIDLTDETVLYRLMTWWNALKPSLGDQVSDTLMTDYDVHYGGLYLESTPEMKKTCYVMHAILVETVMMETGLTVHGARAALDYLNLHYLKFIKKAQDPNTLWAYIDANAEYVPPTPFDGRLIGYEATKNLLTNLNAAYAKLITTDEPLPHGRLERQHLRLLQPHLFRPKSYSSTQSTVTYYILLQFPNTLPFFSNFICDHVKPKIDELLLRHTTHLILHYILIAALTKEDINAFIDQIELNRLSPHFLDTNTIAFLASIQDILLQKTLNVLLMFLKYDIFYQQSIGPVQTLKAFLNKQKNSPLAINEGITNLKNAIDNTQVQDIQYNWLALTRSWILFEDIEYTTIQPTQSNQNDHVLRDIHLRGTRIPSVFDEYVETHALRLTATPSIDDLPMYHTLDWPERIAVYHNLSNKTDLTDYQKVLMETIKDEARSVCIWKPSFYKQSPSLLTWLISSCQTDQKPSARDHFNQLRSNEAPIPAQWHWVMCYLDMSRLSFSGLTTEHLEQLKTQLTALKAQYPMYEAHLQRQIDHIVDKQQPHCSIS